MAQGVEFISVMGITYDVRFVLIQEYLQTNYWLVAWMHSCS